MRFLVGLALVLVAGCRGESGDFCDGCICEMQTECAGSCGKDCTTGCADVTSCQIDCVDNCTLSCERLSSCELDCGNDCTTTCRDLSSCDVVMKTGTALCERVGACNIGCRTDNGIVSATDLGNGMHTCP